MKLFLCSHFSSVGSLIEEKIANRKVAFIDICCPLYHKCSSVICPRPERVNLN